MKRIVKLATNAYGLAVIFGIWVYFFDSSGCKSQRHLKRQINNLSYKTSFYEKEIQRIDSILEFLNDDEKFIRFAREKYFLRKRGEKLFVIEEE